MEDKVHTHSSVLHIQILDKNKKNSSNNFYMSLSSERKLQKRWLKFKEVVVQRNSRKNKF